MKAYHKILRKSLLGLLVLGLVVLSSPPLLARFHLQGISVECDGNTTLATIEADGAVTFNHFSLEEEPFRVVVDLKETVNPAGFLVYEKFPSGNLLSVRTSQFSHSPMVARVVFDFKCKSDYRVEQRGQKLKLSFSTPGQQKFPAVTVLGAKRKPKGNPEPKPVVVAQKSGTVKVETGGKTNSPASPKEQEKKVLLNREKVEYQPKNFRDPFASLVGKEKLTRFLISELPRGESLKLVGIVEEGPHFRALCEDEYGMGYILGDDDPLKDGYVASVEADRVVFIIQEHGWSRRHLLELPSTSR